MHMIQAISEFVHRGRVTGAQGLSDLSIGVLEPAAKGGENAEESFAAYSGPFDFLAAQAGGAARAVEAHDLTAAFLAVNDRLPSLREQKALVRTACRRGLLR